MRDLYLICHFLGLAMGVGSSLSLLILRLSANKLPPTEQMTLIERSMIVSKLGSFGLVLIILSGIGLTLPQWSEGLMLKKEGLFHTKLLLVFLLSLCFGYSQVLQKKSKTDFNVLSKLKVSGLSIALLNVAILIIAVVIFH